MIISFRKGRRSPFARLLPWRKEFHDQTHSESVFSEQKFQFELEKERARVERRIETSQFSLVLLTIPSVDVVTQILVGDLYRRLRITDCIGWCERRLAVLLPETGRPGAERVADNLQEIAARYELDFDPQVLVYPDDDLLAVTSFELSDKSPHPDSWNDDDMDQGPGERELEPASAIRDEGGFSEFKTSLPTPLWKRLIDVFGASAGLICLTPLFAVAGMAVWFSSPGPVFFRQLREGKDGKKFHIYKFRTMCNNAEALKKSLRHRSEQDGPAFKLEQDPRLTTVGKYLRRSCIDELPQLINVLKGDMSLVGPRPLPIDESAECEVWQRRRLMVLPGITCVWQVRGNRNIKFADWMRMDMEYLEKRSLWFDLRLIAETVLAVVLHRGSV